MLRDRRYGGASKATPSTLCQKCLKRDMLIPPMPSLGSTNIFLRHFSYECKALAQERPYVARPSRTQQLMNPKLVPQLTSDVPNDLNRKYVSFSKVRIFRNATVLDSHTAYTRLKTNRRHC